MKTSIRLTIAAFGLAIFSLSAFVAQAQFNYETNNGTITITKYTSPGGSVTIPSTINGLPVTGIGDGVFWGCTNLTSVTIPKSVTSVRRPYRSALAGQPGIGTRSRWCSVERSNLSDGTWLWT